jgi:hypothetical protein
MTSWLCHICLLCTSVRTPFGYGRRASSLTSTCHSEPSIPVLICTVMFCSNICCYSCCLNVCCNVQLLILFALTLSFKSEIGWRKLILQGGTHCTPSLTTTTTRTTGRLTWSTGLWTSSCPLRSHTHTRQLRWEERYAPYIWRAGFLELVCVVQEGLLPLNPALLSAAVDR